MFHLKQLKIWVFYLKIRITTFKDHKFQSNTAIFNVFGGFGIKNEFAVKTIFC